MSRVLPTEIARGGSRPGAALPIAAAVALVLGCLPIGMLFDDGGWLWPSLLTVAAVCGVGAVLRALPVPLLVVPFAQTAAFVALLSWALSDGGPGGPLGRAMALRSLVTDGLAQARVSSAPVEATPGFLAVAAVLIFLAAMLVETLGVGLGLAGLSGLVLLTMAAVPFGLHPSGSLLLLVGPACGWLLLLAVDSRMRLAAVPRPTGRVVRPAVPWLGTAAAAGAGLAIAAFVVSAVLPSAAETAWLRSWWAQLDGGSARSETIDPFVDVRSRLSGGHAQELLRYRSSDGRPTYLAMVTLEEFDGVLWSPYPPSPGTALERPAPGATTRAGDGRVEVSVGGLRNPYLPVPEGTDAIELEGGTEGWGWDTRTGDAVSSGIAAAGRRYQADTVRVAPSAKALEGSGATSAAVSRATTAIPPGLPRQVASLAKEVTAGTTSNYDRAMALQRWFATTGDFRYTLDPPDPAGRDPLLAFLADRAGFCQQYATGMAVMARTLGIPARVVVGFTGGTKQSDGSYLVTGADAHAWPQLWFDGAGWVRFEPTPASGSPGVAAPPYAAPDRAESLPRASPAPAPPQSAPIPTTEPGTASDSSAPGGPPIALLLGLVLCALVAALLALPGAARRRVRRSRLERAARGDAAAAWQEVGASAVDAGLSWDASATIRRQAEGVRSALGSDSGVAAVAAAAESARYGRGATPRSTERGVRSLVVLDEPSIDGEAALADDLHDVVAALDALPRTLAARLLPRSMRRRRFRRS